MLIAVLDTETGGLNAATDPLLEVAVLVYCTTQKRVVRTRAALVKTPESYTVPPEITAINGITKTMAAEAGLPLADVMAGVIADIAMVRTVFAHNAAFDKSFLEAAARVTGIPMPSTPWLDTRTQIPFPEHMKSKRLIHLAAEHGVQIRPAHEATSDCLMLLDILKMYNIEQLTTLVEYRRQSHIKLVTTND